MPEFPVSVATPDFRALFAAAPTPTLIVAPDVPRFTIIDVNEAYLAATMRFHDDLVGSALFEAMPDNPDDLGATGVNNLRASIERVIDAKQADQMPLQKYDIAHPDGGFEERWWNPVNTPVMGVTGDVTAIIHQVVDVTEQVRAEAALHRSQAALHDLNEELEKRVSDRTEELGRSEEALRQSQKMEAIGQLTGGVAHDFNNLLTVIRGSVELLRRPDLALERQRRYIDAIGETAERAARLTSQLLAFARRQALQPVLFDVAASIAEVASMVRTLTGTRIDLQLELPDERLIVCADRSQLDTAVVNLAINARDAMGGEGALAISANAVTRIPARRTHPAVEGDFVAVTVADTGSGIAEADVGRIFEPFFTTKAVGHGTGLGLSQVIGFAKQSGGDIHVESRPGEGATFTLYLPQAAPGPVADAVVREANVDGEGVCVLVVEDNSSVGEFAVNALQELGYDSVLAVSGEHALRELEKDCGRFHVVFSDVVMPGMSGLDLGQRIRRDHPDVPIILTSGYSHVLAETGTHGFELLHKPYSLEQLSRVLRTAVAWQSARKSGRA